jgi:hypothetical protein
VNVFVTGPVGASHSSVFALTGLAPPKAMAEVLSAPAPPMVYLAVAKSATSVQEVPSQNSVRAEAEPVYPPKANVEV